MARTQTAKRKEMDYSKTIIFNEGEDPNANNFAISKFANAKFVNTAFLYQLRYNGEVVYGGVTHCVSERLAAHDKDKVYNSVTFQKVRDDVAFEEESKMIAILNPILNKIGSKPPVTVKIVGNIVFSQEFGCLYLEDVHIMSKRGRIGVLDGEIAMLVKGNKLTKVNLLTGEVVKDEIFGFDRSVRAHDGISLHDHYVFKFGKHLGKTVSEVKAEALGEDYIDWFIETIGNDKW